MQKMRLNGSLPLVSQPSMISLKQRKICVSTIRKTAPLVPRSPANMYVPFYQTTNREFTFGRCQRSQIIQVSAPPLPKSISDKDISDIYDAAVAHGEPLLFSFILLGNQSPSLGSTSLIDCPISTCKIESLGQVASIRSPNESFSTIFCSFLRGIFHRALILSTKKCRYYINIVYCINVTGHKSRRILLCCLRKTSTPPRIFFRNRPRR